MDGSVKSRVSHGELIDGSVKSHLFPFAINPIKLNPAFQ